MSRPSKRIAPSWGASSAPSRWRSVDFPTPESPTTATASPGVTSRSSPFRTSTRPEGPSYHLTTPRASRTTSLMSDCLDGAERRRFPGRIDRRDQGDAQRQEGHDEDVAGPRAERHVGDVVDVRVEADDLVRIQ